MYKNDFDRVQTQLNMLPDLIRTRNTTCSGAPIMQSTIKRTISKILSELHICQDLFHKFQGYLKFYYSQF